jgi:hypothetical protein
MNQWLHKFFMYLDRYYVDHHNLPKLLDAGAPRSCRRASEGRG